MVSTSSAQTEWSRRRGMVIAAGALSAVALMLASASPSIAATRAGLSLDGSTPSPTVSGEMPGMDHGAGEESGTDPGHSSMAGEAAPDRPIVPVLGTFGGGTSAVLLAAGFLRRRDRLRNQAKAAARAARRSAK